VGQAEKRVKAKNNIREIFFVMSRKYILFPKKKKSGKTPLMKFNGNFS
jgi:hypothetical protein